MSIVYSFCPEISKIRDFFVLLNLLTKSQNLEDCFKQSDLQIPPAITETFSGIWVRTRDVIPDCELFCASESKSMSFLYDLLISEKPDLTDMQDALSYFKSLTSAKIVTKMLTYFDEKANYSEHFYTMITATPELLVEYLNSLCLSDNTKWKMINFISSPVSVLERCLTALEKVRLELENAYQANQDLINALNEEIKQLCETAPESILDENEPKFASVVTESDIQTIRFSTLFFAPLSVQYVKLGNQLDIFLGYDYDKAIQRFSDVKTDPVSMFKAFTDDSRLSILQLVKTQELCASDISRQLSIPMSSLAYHLSTLTTAGALCTRQEGKKVIYSFNDQMFSQAVRFLTKLSS